MSFFKLSSKKLVFTESSRKHNGKTVEEVAKTDPQYLIWARRERTVGLAPALFDLLDDVMTSQGVPFSVPRKKKSSPHRK